MSAEPLPLGRAGAFAPSAPTKSSSSRPRRQALISALPLAPDPDVLFQHLVTAVRDGGAFVSAKVARRAVPPAMVPGLVAVQRFDGLEQILRVPFELQISREFAKQRARDMTEAVARCGPKVRIECPEIVAFVATLLSDLELGGWCGAGAADATKLARHASWLDLFIGMQLGSDFGTMPHMLLVGDEERRSLFRPSPEVHNADWNYDAFVDAYKALLAAAPDFCEGIELQRFVQAYLILLTRTFSCESFHRFVPVADMMNHSAAPNATWTFDERGDFVVKTLGPVEAGEEVTISYGRDKSNVRLFRTYGFTAQPKDEPCWAFRVWPSQAAAVYQHFLPERVWRKTIDLESCRIDSTLQEALAACASAGHRPAAFLDALCRHFREHYDADVLLAPLLARWASLRREPGAAAAAAWWADGEAAGASEEDWLVQCAVRVKMSEYMCLTAHLEALDILAGAVGPGDCMEMSVHLHGCLVEALRGLPAAACQ